MGDVGLLKTAGPGQHDLLGGGRLALASATTAGPTRRASRARKGLRAWQRLSVIWVEALRSQAVDADSVASPFECQSLHEADQGHFCRGNRLTGRNFHRVPEEEAVNITRPPYPRSFWRQPACPGAMDRAHHHEHRVPVGNPPGRFRRRFCHAGCAGAADQDIDLAPTLNGPAPPCPGPGPDPEHWRE